MDHSDPEVRKSAFIAAGRTTHAFFVPQLVNALSTDQTRDLAIDALVLSRDGLIPELRDRLQNRELPVHVFTAFPVIAARIPSRESVDFCFELLTHEEAEVRLEAIRALNILKQNYPDYKVDKIRIVNEIRREARLYQDTLSVLYIQIQAAEQEESSTAESQVQHARQKLITLLEKKLDADLETIFQLLGLHYASEEILAVYKVLKSDARDTRSDALEFLENLMEPNLKRMLMPIIESAMWDSITEEAIRKMKIRIPDEYSCYKMILQGEHHRLKRAVLKLFRQLQDVRYLPLIEVAVRDKDRRLSEYAVKTREFI
jgi:AAA family ATP:ADP antiporter